MTDELRYDAARAHEIAERLRSRFRVTRERIENRRLHYYNDESVDPVLGEWENGQPVPDNPFADVSRYQSDAPRRATQAVVARLTENQAIISVVPPRDTPTLKERASDLAIVLNSGMYQIMERTDVNWQQAMSTNQVRDCYAILHTCRLDALRPGIEKEEYDESEFESKVEDEKRRADFIYRPDGKYAESASSYNDRITREYAGLGFPWHVEFIDPYFFAYERDRLGGLSKVLVAYEVDLLDYEEALQDSNKDEATAVGRLVAAPGSASDDGEYVDSPSRSEYDRRAQVWQFWTNEEYYEFCDHGEASNNAFQLTKSFKHGYREVPFRIVWGNKTFDSDPAWASEPYIEGIYRNKPFYDRMLTLTSAITELTADPITYETEAPGAPSPVLEDGSIQEQGSESSLGKRLPAGRKLEQLNIQITHGLPQIIQLLTALMQEAEPATGAVELGATTAPWTARIWQTQANIGPKLLVNNQMSVIKWWGNFVKNWHADHPEEPLSSFYYDAGDRKLFKDKIVKIDTKDLDKFEVECTISPLSSAEQITMMDHLTNLYERGYIKRVDIYEKGLNVKDPHEYMASLDAEKAIKPYQDLWVDSNIKARLNQKYLMDTEGNWVNGMGQMTEPEDAIASLGYSEQKPPEPVNTSNATDNSLPLTQKPMRQLPPFEAPGTMPLPGMQ